MFITAKISSQYQMLKFLFKSSQYLYTLTEQKSTQIIVPAIISDYNQELDQYIKMFRNKLAFNSGIQKHIVVPKSARKQIFNGKKINLCIIRQKLIPLYFIMEKQIKTQSDSKQKDNQNQVYDSKQSVLSLTIDQMELKIITIFQDIVRALYMLHSNDFIHGRISMHTIYGQVDQMSGALKFYLNVLDCLNCFNKNYKFQEEQYLFRPQGQSFGIPYSQKQDLQSLIYVIVHLCSNQKIFSVENMKKQISKDGPMIGKWKSCSFYKSMIQILPKRLCFISDFYLYLKTLDINDKPNYAYWLKVIQNQHKTYLKMIYDKQHPQQQTKNKLQEDKIQQVAEQNQICGESQVNIKINIISKQKLDEEQNILQQDYKNQIIQNYQLSEKLNHLKQIWISNKSRLIPQDNQKKKFFNK